MLAAVSCRLLAVCSVRELRSWLPVAISCDAVSMLSVALRTRLTVRVSEVFMSPSARSRSPNSSVRSVRTSRRRSPAATSRVTSTAWARGCVTERVMRQASTMASPLALRASSINRPIWRLTVASDAATASATARCCSSSSSRCLAP